MKKDMIIKNCDIVLCEIKNNESLVIVLPQIRFNGRYFSEQDFDLEEEDFLLIKDIREKFLTLYSDEMRNYLKWKIDKDELPRHIKAMVVNFRDMEDFYTKTVW